MSMSLSMTKTFDRTCNVCSELSPFLLAPFWGQYSGLPPNPWPQHQVQPPGVQKFRDFFSLLEVLICNDPHLKLKTRYCFGPRMGLLFYLSPWDKVKEMQTLV